MALVERCRLALATLGESSTARGFREALAAAGDGQGDETAKALSALGEPQRFVATVLIGLAFPAVRAATAIAFDAAVPPGLQAVHWSRICQLRMVERWAGACEDVPPAVLARLLGRSGYITAATATLAAVRARLAAGLVEDASALQETIDPAAKEDRAAARAAIGRKVNDDGQLMVALLQAEAGLMAQTGGEETQASADVLRELSDLPATHHLVKRCIARLRDWGRTRVEKDARSYGVTSAVEVCVKAGWIEHARALPDTISRRVRQAARLLVSTGGYTEAIELARLAGFPAG